MLFCKIKNRPLVSETCKPQYIGWLTKNFNIKLNNADCYVKLKSGQMVVIENIASSSRNGEIVIIGRTFIHIKDFFVNPCKSPLLNIYEGSELGELQYWPLSVVQEKLICLPLEYPINDQHQLFILPFLHLSL